MSWRAFTIGILAVLGLSLLAPYNDYVVGNTYLTGNHFPVGAFFLLLVLTLVVNVAIKLLHARWALRQAELMLVFSMMLVSATVPASGLQRYLFPLTASPPYLSQRLDIPWGADVLPVARPGVLLSNKPHSDAVAKFFEGARGETVRVPWGQWSSVLVAWGIFVAFYYAGTFFLGGILRRQWVDYERLQFPLARFPLDVTAGSEGRGLLPEVFRNRAFLVGVVASLLFSLVRISPLLTGGETGLEVTLPVNSVLQNTPLAQMNLANGTVYPIAIGFAFLVTSEVSLSMWLFYLLYCVQGQVIYSWGIPVQGGSYQFGQWQQAGAYVVFTAGVFWAARRHLWGVLLRALGRRGGAPDADEPIPYRVGFWGLLVCTVGMTWWFVHFGVSVWVACVVMALMLTLVVVHARLITQGGVILTGQAWMPGELLQGAFGGGIFSGAGAVVVQAQGAIMLADAREMLSPHAMNALRIASVFERGRRFFLPAMLAALAVALVAAGYSSLRWVYYKEGALNLANTYAITWHSLRAYNVAHSMIANPAATQPHYVALFSGAGLMVLLLGMRGAFYWWPINPLGVLLAASWAITPLWFNFLMGWLAKVSVLAFGSGGALRSARSFFLGVIAGETAMVGLSTFFSLLTGIRIGYIFMPG